jgi:Zn-finger protein
MGLAELFNGIAVIIDDEIDNQEKNIKQIIDQLNDKKIPVVKYTSLLDIQAIIHMQNISFLLLDWQLFSMSPDIDTSGMQEQNDADNIKFLIQFFKKCFCPIFIFTNESVEDIVLKLSEKGVYDEAKPNRIFIKNKADVVEVNLFREITKWMKSIPSMYVLKQ